MDRETDRPQDVAENPSEAQGRSWQEPRLTRHGDLERVTGQGLLQIVSLPPDPGPD